jgi:ABC-type uncharacterized transport system involved in gliding motility auxiliary subunit
MVGNTPFGQGQVTTMKLSLTRIKHSAVTLAFLGLLGAIAALSTLYPVQIDITANAGNTLSVASQKLLATMPEPFSITAYVKQTPSLRLQIKQLIDRYRQFKPAISLDFIDPASAPEKIRELNIGPEGAVIVSYQGRSERINYLDESTLTNALFQLINAKDRWLSFLSGHGERSPGGVANFDLGQFGKELERKKIKAQSINLVTVPSIPTNSALLVLSSPAVALLPGEIDIIRQYIEKGGNLLILTDPDKHHMDVFLETLGIKQLPGLLVDGQSKLFGINDPAFIVVSEYPKNPVSKDFQTLTVYPTVAALMTAHTTAFKPQLLLESSKQSWTESGEIAGKIRFDANSDEQQGPLPFAYTLTRNLNNKLEQRIIVVGDGDFLSNTYIGNVGNLDMGLRMVNWLIHDDQYIDIPAKTSVDTSFHLSKIQVAIMGFGFLIFLPLGLLITGFVVWHRRKRR